MQDLETALINLAGYIDLFWILLLVICSVAGATFIVLALSRAAQRANSDPQRSSYARPLANALTGIVLLAFPILIGVLNTTLWGSAETESAERIFEYAPTLLADTGGRARQVIVAIVTLIQFLGAIALIRGILFLNEHYQGSTTAESRFGRGLTFGIAGAIAINFPKFMGLLDNLV